MITTFSFYFITFFIIFHCAFRLASWWLFTFPLFCVIYCLPHVSNFTWVPASTLASCRVSPSLISPRFVPTSSASTSSAGFLSTQRGREAGKEAGRETGKEGTDRTSDCRCERNNFYILNNLDTDFLWFSFVSSFFLFLISRQMSLILCLFYSFRKICLPHLCFHVLCCALKFLHFYIRMIALSNSKTYFSFYCFFVRISAVGEIFPKMFFQ